MEENIELIRELLQEVKAIKEALTNPLNKVETDKWMDNTDVKEMLHVGDRTLQRFRKSGMLKYSKIKGKIYYRLTDIHTMLEQNLVE